MEEIIKNAILEYQCSGCVSGPGLDCFTKNEYDQSCGSHHSGTSGSWAGRFFLGMPKGFCRIGHDKNLKINIYKNFKMNDQWVYDLFNIPTWKHLNESGHTIIRGHMPRINGTFLHIYLEDCLDKIKCIEISKEEVDGME